MDDLKKTYLMLYRQESYAKLHWEVWKSLNPKYFRHWREKNSDYGKDYYEQKIKEDGYYARNRSRLWRENNPGYYQKYRTDNHDKLKKYWRIYKRKKRRQKSVTMHRSREVSHK